MSRSLSDDRWSDLIERAAEAEAEHRRRFPGDAAASQPLHTVYVPADRITPTTTVGFGTEALRLLETHAPDPAAFEEAFGVDAPVAERARTRVHAKLERQPVEDLRVDFEDGYGARSDDEEDRHAEVAARALHGAREAGTAPASFGLRVKSFADGRQARSVRTLDTFLTTLIEASGGLPEGFVVTFPKVNSIEHVAIFAEVLERLELGLGLPDGTLRFEVQMVRSPRRGSWMRLAGGSPRFMSACSTTPRRSASCRGSSGSITRRTISLGNYCRWLWPGPALRSATVRATSCP